MRTMVFNNGQWQASDGTKPTYEELAQICNALEQEMSNQQEWRYGHYEIEASCGGEMAIKIREHVINRRQQILTEQQNIIYKQ